MKVLIVIPEFPVKMGNIKGGVNSALYNLLKGLSDKDVTIRVLSFNREIPEPILLNYSKNIAIHFIPEGKLPHFFNYCFKGSAAIKKHIREFNPLIVHYAMSGYILLTKMFGLLNTVQMVTIHGVPFSEARQQINIKGKLVYYTNGIVELLFKPVSTIHISKYSSAQYRNKKKYKPTIIANAINPDYFKIPFKNNTSNKLLYAGSIEANKNILFILKALRLLIDKGLFFSLQVLGDFTNDGYKEDVLAFIKNNNLEEYITMYGWVSQEKLKEVMAQSDILIVSSKQETLPMVIAEAMSAGKVVVCATVGGIPEMVHHGEDGFLFNTFAVENVLPVLEKLYNNNTLIQQIQTNARKKAIKTYHCDIVAQKTISFYQSLLH